MHLYFIYFKNLKSSDLKNQVKSILYSCDKEFLPALSLRENSTQTKLKYPSKYVSSHKPISYYKTMIKQSFILAMDGRSVVGFMSFIYDYKNDVYDKAIDTDINLYITTLCVKKIYRGNRISYKLYEKIESLKVQDKRIGYISTRTWSENHTHLKTLYNLGYHLIKTISNDRGEGIDTVYFLKDISNF